MTIACGFRLRHPTLVFTALPIAQACSNTSTGLPVHALATTDRRNGAGTLKTCGGGQT